MKINNINDFEDKLNQICNKDINTNEKQKEFIKLFNLKTYKDIIIELISNEEKTYNIFNLYNLNYTRLTHENGRGNLQMKTAKKFIELLSFEKKNLQTNYLFENIIGCISSEFIIMGTKLNNEVHKEYTDILTYLLFNKTFPLIKTEFKNEFCKEKYSYHYGSYYLDTLKHKKLVSIIINNLKKLNKNKLYPYAHILRSIISHINVSSINALMQIEEVEKFTNIKEVKNNTYYQQIQNEILFNFIETYISFNYGPQNKEEMLNFLVKKQFKFYDLKNQFFAPDRILNLRKEFYRELSINKYSIDKINKIIQLFIEMQGSYNFCDNLLLKELFRSGLYELFVNFTNEHYDLSKKENIEKILKIFKNKSLIKKLNNQSPLFGMLKTYKEEQKNIIAYLEQKNLDLKLSKKEGLRCVRNKI